MVIFLPGSGRSQGANLISRSTSVVRSVGFATSRKDMGHFKEGYGPLQGRIWAYITGWWFQIFFLMFTPILGFHDPI